MLPAIDIPMIAFVCGALLPLASSIWLRSRSSLGKPFWILSFFVMLPVLASVAVFLLTPPDLYGFATVTSPAQRALPLRQIPRFPASASGSGPPVAQSTSSTV